MNRIRTAIGFCIFLTAVSNVGANPHRCPLFNNARLLQSNSTVTKVDIKQLRAQVHKLKTRRLMLVGTLNNLSRNYFESLQIVLIDSVGDEVEVSTSLPTEAIPPEAGGRNIAPTTISSYLGKKVVVIAVIDQLALKSHNVLILKILSIRETTESILKSQQNPYKTR